MTQQQTIRRIVHVSRHPTGESLRCALAIKRLEGVRLLGICQGAPRADAREVFADLVPVEDVHDSGQLVAAARLLCDKHGPLSRMVTAQETLLEPVARANEALSLEGMSVATVRRALDKSCLKKILEGAGIRTARDRLITDDAEAWRFADEVGWPIVLKPLGGSGGLATWCLRSAAQLHLALGLMKPSPLNPFLAEDYLPGEELCLDTITIDDEPRFHSLCCYRPSILEALEDPRVQWTCVMPREMSGDRYVDFIQQGLKAVRALAVGNAMTHMEGFLLEDGGLSFTDATLRPAGARIAPMLAFAYDMDPHRAWARVAVDACFDGPWERKYAVGTIFLRGTGQGLLEEIEGVEAVRRETRELLVEARWPRVGAQKSATYTGDGYLTIRHPETRVVEDALHLIAQTVRLTYSQVESPASSTEALGDQWGRRLGYFDKQLNRPVWDDDSLPGL